MKALKPLKLEDILGTFNTVKTQLTTFIEEQTEVNNVNRELLQTGEAEVKEANAALKQIRKFVGK